MAPRRQTCELKTLFSLNVSCRRGRWGLGESYMDGWWDCERLDIFFHKVLRAGLEKQLPHHFKDTLRIAGARLFNLQSKKTRLDCWQRALRSRQRSLQPNA